jgi:hypothetical protein
LEDDMKSHTLLLLIAAAPVLAGCVTTDTPAPASYAPMPVQYGTGMRLMDPMIGVAPPPMRSQILMAPTPRGGMTPYYVNEAFGTTTVTPGVLQPLRPVQLRPLN